MLNGDVTSEFRLLLLEILGFNGVAEEEFIVGINFFVVKMHAMQ